MSNQKIMGTFMELQLKRQQQMNEEAANQQAAAVNESQLAVASNAALPSTSTDTPVGVEDNALTTDSNEGNSKSVS